MTRYPDFYAASAEFRALQAALEPEILALWERRDSLQEQLTVDTATWGLAYWERTLGIPVEVNRDIELRRNRVRACLRGLGVTTEQVLRSVIETFFPGGEVSIVEHAGAFLVEIRLTLTGQPVTAHDELNARLRLILPAHLVWRLSVTLESRGGIALGGCGELAGRVEVWPLVARTIDSTGTAALSGAAAYHASMEIYPQGGMANG